MLGYLLKLMSSKFHLISEHPSKQFFHLFNVLIDLHYNRLSDQDDAQLFDAEQLLGQIIDKIRADNKNSKTQKSPDGVDEAMLQEYAAERENMMVGLINMTQKIMNKVD